ncbi:hypothetical protein D1007_48595 [Hordeum vulgare]|nr:hypothetical protein D1007_48595 [Hordeum vulgare]
MEFGMYHVNTHIRNPKLLVVYTNDLVKVENSINTMVQLLADDDMYKVVGFNLEYTDGPVRYDRKVVVSQLCVCHHTLVYHYCVSTMPCGHFATFVNRPNYRFWHDEEKKEKDSLVDLAEAIIDPYYTDMKAECNRDKPSWHKARVKRLDEDNLMNAVKDGYTCYGSLT